MHPSLIILSAIVFLVVFITAWAWRSMTLKRGQAARKTLLKKEPRRSQNREVQHYLDTVAEMERLIWANKYDQAYVVARRWCNRASKFAEEWTKLHGKFEVAELPPIEYAAKHLVALRNVPELRRLRDVISATDSLKRWNYLLVDEIVAAKELERIYGIVQRQPGIDQIAAAREAGADPRRAISALADADVRNLIRRDHEGDRNLLFVR